MAGVARIPRRRGSLCGVLLILLGAWGAVIPFIGPYFSFAYTPDKTWAYTSGRLYLSILPGAAAVLAGLLVLATRSRTLGVLAGLLAAIGGAWFIVGSAIVGTVLRQTSISPGVPLVHATSAISAPRWVFLETAGFFLAVGILVIFFGALAMGRFSMLSARDTADEDYDDDYPSSTDQAPASYQSPSGSYDETAAQYPPTPRPFPGEQPTQSEERVATSTGQFPAATSPSPFPPATSPSPFPPSTAPGPYPPPGSQFPADQG
jgi:hypothetical protein